MTKQELLSNPVFQKARDDAFIYFVAKCHSIYRARAVYFTAPKREYQTKDRLRLGTYGPLITKGRLMANQSFRHTMPHKTICVMFPDYRYDLGDCNVETDSNGDIVITEK